MATLGERIVEAIGGITREEYEQGVARAKEAAYAQGYNDGNDEPTTGTTKSLGYRSTSKGLRDFGKASAQQLMDTAWSLWQSSPVAKRIMTLKRDHIAGRNVSPVVTGDDDAVGIVTDFWATNRMSKRAGEFALQLFLLGEQCYPAFVRESDGRTKLGYIDPSEITDIICHPENAMEMWAVVVGENNAGKRAKVYRIIREDEEAVIDGRVVQPRYPGKLVTWEQATREQWESVMLAEYGRSEYNGSVFWSGVNRLSNQKRGVSDLIQVADWIDQADETLFALGDREQYADFFSWFVGVTGGPDQVDKRTRQIMANPPKKGSINVYTLDAEKWDMMTPDLRQEGSIATYRAILGLILGGVGFPVHWFGYGDDANRATALAQGDPTIKSLEYDQASVRDMLEMILQFVIDQAIIAGNLSENDEIEVAVNLPELSTKDMAQVVPLFGPFAIALMTAAEAGWITEETAAKSWARLMAEFGIDIDPMTELEAVAAEAMDDEQERNDQLVGNLASAAASPDGRLTSGDVEPEIVLNGSA